jgi:hypothetical protein
MKKEKIKPGQIRITPSDNRLLTMPPHVNAINNPPSWFSKISKERGSIRRCAGTIDMLSAGITIPCWTNFDFKLDDKTKTWETRGSNFGGTRGHQDVGAIEHFPYQSVGECPISSIRKVENSFYQKLINPWKIETAPGWSILQMPIYWEPNENYTILPAIIHTDFYHTANIVLNLTSDKPFTIKYGTPLVQIIPFKRDSDFESIIFEDESNFKYVDSTGFGFGHIFPTNGTSGPYRREKMRIDEELANHKQSLVDKILRRK